MFPDPWCHLEYSYSVAVFFNANSFFSTLHSKGWELLLLCRGLGGDLGSVTGACT